MIEFLSKTVTLWLLIAVDTVTSHRIVDAQTGGLPSSAEARYACSFGNLWTQERHPNYYPMNMAVWKAPIFAVHSSDYKLWAEGEMATSQFATYVEDGDSLWLTVTALMAGENIEDLEPLMDLDAESTLMQEDFPTWFRVTQKNPLISSVAPMSPSPDWFTGFHDFEPRNTTTDTWYKSFVIKTFPMDAGTVLGDFYEKVNVEDFTRTNPQQPIQQLDINTIPHRSGVFMNYNHVGDGSDVLPVAKWTCTLVNDMPVPPQQPAPPAAPPANNPPQANTPPQANNPPQTNDPPPQANNPPQINAPPQNDPPPQANNPPQTSDPPPQANNPPQANDPPQESNDPQPADNPPPQSTTFQLLSAPYP